MKQTIIIILIICLQSIALANDIIPPANWRTTTNSDYSKEDLSFMNNITPNHIIADFNGDGLKDEAWILIKKRKIHMDYLFFLEMKAINLK